MEILDNRRISDRRHGFPQAGTSYLLWAFDHESNVRRRALEHLERDGFCVRMVPIGPDVVRRTRQLYPSLVVIETITVPGSALDLCRGIRQLHSMSRTPIILLSGSACQEDRALALESGADDCITEPWSGREIVARARAVLRRFTRRELHSDPIPKAPAFPQYWSSVGSNVKAGEIEIDASAMRVAVRGSVVETTSLEFRLLYYLLHNQGRVFTREQLLNAVWGAEFVEPRSVDACIRRLRRKIELKPFHPSYLKTVRGAGYCLQAVAS
jgi:DNA-binding response OmpR family regulator